MTESHYIILSLEDAKLLANYVIDGPSCDERDHTAYLVAKNLRGETGAPIGEVAVRLKKFEICAACSIEGQSRTCHSIGAQAIGRRLFRLVERATKRRQEG